MGFELCHSDVAQPPKEELCDQECPGCHEMYPLGALSYKLQLCVDCLEVRANGGRLLHSFRGDGRRLNSEWSEPCEDCRKARVFCSHRRLL